MKSGVKAWEFCKGTTVFKVFIVMRLLMIGKNRLGRTCCRREFRDAKYRHLAND